MSEQDMIALLLLLERTLGPSWRDVVAYLVAANPVADVARAIERHDFDNAIVGIDDAAARFAIDEHAAYTRAGTAAADWLDEEVTPLVRFDQTNVLAVKWAEANKLDKIREISQDQRAVIRSVITDGVRDGESPLDIATDLRASIGLTEKQLKVVDNYRAALEAGNYNAALERELSSGHSDRAIAAAVRNERILTQAQIDTAVARYRANFVTYRSQMIARTEALRVLHQGTEDGLRMAIARGDVDASELEQEWHHSNVGKDPRDFHQVMDGQKRRIGESFVSGHGVELRYPGDPRAPASEVIACKCVKSTRYKRAA